jgi:hypothetical protein
MGSGGSADRVFYLDLTQPNPKKPASAGFFMTGVSAPRLKTGQGISEAFSLLQIGGMQLGGASVPDGARYGP